MAKYFGNITFSSVYKRLISNGLELKESSWLVANPVICAVALQITPTGSVEAQKTSVTWQAQDYYSASDDRLGSYGTTSLESDEWLRYDVRVPAKGYYRLVVSGSLTSKSGSIWVEDYILSTSRAPLDITGKMKLLKGKSVVDGIPLDKGKHHLKVHASGARALLDSMSLELLEPYTTTEKVFTQNMEGKEWSLVWNDEFAITDVPDSTNWTFEFGNWGWYNGELQYYTNQDKRNAYVTDGNLVIRALKNKKTKQWTSARITTKGRQSFLYGAIEFRAKIPSGNGNWCAALMLGDQCFDGLTWPECGEIDIFSSVGYEIDKHTEEGRIHSGCQTPMYNFLLENQKEGKYLVEKIGSEYHTYSIEWYPEEIKAFVDGNHFYTFKRPSDDSEWPYNQPHNIVINLAIGGEKSRVEEIEKTLLEQELYIDYVRVYEKE